MSKSQFASIRLFALILGASIFSGSLSAAEPGSWKWPNLNPFNRPAQPTGGASVNPWVQNNNSTSGGSSSWNIFKPQPSTGPSTWQKFTTASKNNWTKVKDAVNPFDKPTSVPPKVKAPDSSYSWGSTTQQKNTKPSGGGMWPWSKPAESKPQTVNDFLSQQRPE